MQIHEAVAQLKENNSAIETVSLLRVWEGETGNIAVANVHKVDRPPEDSTLIVIITVGSEMMYGYQLAPASEIFRQADILAKLGKCTRTV